MWWGCYTSIHDGTLSFSAHYENMGLGNSGESCDSGESADSIDFGDYGDYSDFGAYILILWCQD